MKKKKKIKTVIMKPEFRKGAWLHGKNEKGFSIVVPVTCVGVFRDYLPRGFREYKF